MNYAKYWKQGADKATRKHNAHIEKCNRVIEAGENGLPGGDTAEAGELRRKIEGMRIEALNLTSENKRLRHDLEQKSTMVADLSVRVDDAAKKVGNGNGPGNGAKGGENSVQVATLVEPNQSFGRNSEDRSTGKRAAQGSIGAGHADLGVGLWEYLDAPATDGSADPGAVRSSGACLLQHNRSPSWRQDPKSASR